MSAGSANQWGMKAASQRGSYYLSLSNYAFHVSIHLSSSTQCVSRWMQWFMWQFSSVCCFYASSFSVLAKPSPWRQTVLWPFRIDLLCTKWLLHTTHTHTASVGLCSHTGTQRSPTSQRLRVHRQGRRLSLILNMELEHGTACCQWNNQWIHICGTGFTTTWTTFWVSVNLWLCSEFRVILYSLPDSGGEKSKSLCKTANVLFSLSKHDGLCSVCICQKSFAHPRALCHLTNIIFSVD